MALVTNRVEQCLGLTFFKPFPPFSSIVTGVTGGGETYGFSFLPRQYCVNQY